MSGYLYLWQCHPEYSARRNEWSLLCLTLEDTLLFKVAAVLVLRLHTADQLDERFDQVIWHIYS